MDDESFFLKEPKNYNEYKNVTIEEVFDNGFFVCCVLALIYVLWVTIITLVLQPLSRLPLVGYLIGILITFTNYFLMALLSFTGGVIATKSGLINQHFIEIVRHSLKLIFNYIISFSSF